MADAATAEFAPQGRFTAEAVGAALGKFAAGAVRTAGHLREKVDWGGGKLRDRISGVPADLPTLRRPWREDARCVAEYARACHRKRPLRAVAVVAGAAFVFGLMAGLGRR